jgi:hypothetical protein
LFFNISPGFSLVASDIKSGGYRFNPAAFEQESLYSPEKKEKSFLQKDFFQNLKGKNRIGTYYSQIIVKGNLLPL